MEWGAVLYIQYTKISNGEHTQTTKPSLSITVPLSVFKPWGHYQATEYIVYQPAEIERMF